MTSLFIISALFGLFQGGIVPSYAIIVREHFPPAEAGARVGTVLMFTMLGMALGAGSQDRCSTGPAPTQRLSSMASAGTC